MRHCRRFRRRSSSSPQASESIHCPTLTKYAHKQSVHVQAFEIIGHLASERRHGCSAQAPAAWAHAEQRVGGRDLARPAAPTDAEAGNGIHHRLKRAAGGVGGTQGGGGWRRPQRQRCKGGRAQRACWGPRREAPATSSPAPKSRCCCLGSSHCRGGWARWGDRCRCGARLRVSQQAAAPQATLALRSHALPHSAPSAPRQRPREALLQVAARGLLVDGDAVGRHVGGRRGQHGQANHAGGRHRVVGECGAVACAAGGLGDQRRVRTGVQARSRRKRAAAAPGGVPALRLQLPRAHRCGPCGQPPPGWG